MPNPSTPHLERDSRQRDLVPPDRLADCHALVIGVGAIGRQVALQLAALGMPRLTLVDPDDVRVENLAPQGYLAEDVQALKVEATAALCSAPSSWSCPRSPTSRWSCKRSSWWSSTRCPAGSRSSRSPAS